MKFYEFSFAGRVESVEYILYLLYIQVVTVNMVHQFFEILVSKTSTTEVKLKYTLPSSV